MDCCYVSRPEFDSCLAFTYHSGKFAEKHLFTQLRSRTLRCVYVFVRQFLVAHFTDVCKEECIGITDVSRLIFLTAQYTESAARFNKRHCFAKTLVAKMFIIIPSVETFQTLTYSLSFTDIHTVSENQIPLHFGIREL